MKILAIGDFHGKFPEKLKNIARGKRTTPTATIGGNLSLAVPTTAGTNTLNLLNNINLSKKCLGYIISPISH